MRILTMVFGLGPGGTERSAQNCSIAYADHGHEVAVLAYRADGSRRATLEQAGLPVFLGDPDEAAVERAIEDAIRWRPDVVHVHRTGGPDPESGAILRRLRAAGPTRVIETNHFSRVDDSADRTLIDVHMQLSRWCMWKWRRWSRGLRPPPLSAIVPHIIDSTTFHPEDDATRQAFRAEYAIPADAFVFGRVGQPHHSKWSPVAFQAFASLAARNERVWLVIAGLSPSQRPAIERMPSDIRRRVVEIEFLHGDDAIRAAYAGMDVFLHSAQIGESFGMVLAEAMLCERPVITIATPAHDNSQLEVVGHDRGGLVAHDAASMGEAMERLIDDDALRERLGRGGRAWCLEQYDAGRIADIMIRIAELVLANPARADLSAALDADPLVETSVSWSDLRRLLDDGLGAPSRRELALMRLVHRPFVYKGVRLLRRLRPPA